MHSQSSSAALAVSLLLGRTATAAQLMSILLTSDAGAASAGLACL
jgi:hypothetical protein